MNETQTRKHDPHVADPTLDLQSLEKATADAAVITAVHDEYVKLDPATLGEQTAQKTVIGTKTISDPGRWRQAGFTIQRI